MTVPYLVRSAKFSSVPCVKSVDVAVCADGGQGTEICRDGPDEHFLMGNGRNVRLFDFYFQRWYV